MAERPHPAEEDRCDRRLRNCSGHGAGVRDGLAEARLARGGVCAGWDFTGAVEALEDSIAGEIVPAFHHGIPYGTPEAVNAVGHFASSLLVRALWTAAAPTAAFATTGALFAAADELILILRER